jgi:adenylate kinase family enzyme
MVLITGIPAAGKSTVADLLARRFEQGVHVKGDIYPRMIVAGRSWVRRPHPTRRDPAEEGPYVPVRW